MVFQVPAGADLPEYMRRRLVELGRDFILDDDFDRVGDFGLATMLVDYLLDVTMSLSEDDDQIRDFSRFLRTRDPRERTAWLRDSASLRAIVDLPAQAIAERSTAQIETDSTAQAGYRDEVVQLLENLAAVARRRDTLSKPQAHVRADPAPSLAGLVGLVAGGCSWPAEDDLGASGTSPHRTQQSAGSALRGHGRFSYRQPSPRSLCLLRVSAEPQEPCCTRCITARSINDRTRLSIPTC